LSAGNLDQASSIHVKAGTIPIFRGGAFTSVSIPEPDVPRGILGTSDGAPWIFGGSETPASKVPAAIMRPFLIARHSRRSGTGVPPYGLPLVRRIIQVRRTFPGFSKDGWLMSSFPNIRSACRRRRRLLVDCHRCWSSEGSGRRRSPIRWCHIDVAWCLVFRAGLG
jgi:hypothetical protein